MILTRGTKLGPYEILGALGAGGMGEVYRARDPRLDRDVAIKVLPTAFSRDPGRLRRFELEARAAGALNHPNILTIYDIGTHQDAPYVVSELLEGQTLRERIREGRLPQRKAIEYAVEIARGLAVAHQKGIAHRDIKPENLFLTKDDRIKILDFGLAKLTQPEGTDSEALTQGATQPGTVMGSPGYMSPEQARAQTSDHRSDIFSFGAVLYELLTGERAFQGGSSVEIMNAILKEEPPPIESPALDRLVKRCLEKDPAHRFQSAADLSYSLEAVTGLSVAAIPALPVAPRSPARWKPLLAGLVGLVAVAAAFFAGRQAATSPAPSFQQLTFRRGSIQTARFAPDGQTIVYGARWEGHPWEVFSTRLDSFESRPLGIPNAEVHSVSANGEMALHLNGRIVAPLLWLGTLARAPLAGGAAREVLDDVEAADWSPDGKELAVSHYVDGRTRLEYPIGKVLYETRALIFRANLRVSPKGDRIAFIESRYGTRGSAVSVVDLAGNKKELSGGWNSTWGLAWSPAGDEVWFAASDTGMRAALYSVTLSGRRRLLLRTPGILALRDVSRDGRILLISQSYRATVTSLVAGETRERDLSWMDLSLPADLSADGKTLLLLVTEPSGRLGIYLRQTDGSPAVRLGETSVFSTTAAALSPDGRWVLAIGSGPKPRLILLPTRAGEAREVAAAETGSFSSLAWFADGKRFLFAVAEPGQGPRLFVRELAGDKAIPVTPEGVAILGDFCVSPDGRWVAAARSDQQLWLYPVNGGAARPVAGATPGDLPVRFTSDGRALFLFRKNELPISVYRLSLERGTRELWRELAPGDPSGAESYFARVLLTPDGKSHVYSIDRMLSELYLVQDLK